MSEFAITMMRFGFLAALWFAVFAIILVLRRDLAAPKYCEIFRTLIP